MNAEFEKQIENLPKKGNSIKDKLFSKDYFLRSTEFGISTIDKKEIIFDSKKSNLGNFILAGIAAILVSLKFKEPNVIYSLIIIIVALMTIGYFFTLKKKNKIIKINLVGLEIENLTFEWNDIYDFGVLVKPSKHITYYELIIFLNSNGRKDLICIPFKMIKMIF